LRGEDQVDPEARAFARSARSLLVFTGHHHQVGQFVDDDDDSGSPNGLKTGVNENGLATGVPPSLRHAGVVAGQLRTPSVDINR
jgi:hypothetical protein